MLVKAFFLFLAIEGAMGDISVASAQAQSPQEDVSQQNASEGVRGRVRRLSRLVVDFIAKQVSPAYDDNFVHQEPQQSRIFDVKSKETLLALYDCLDEIILLIFRWGFIHLVYRYFEVEVCHNLDQTIVPKTDPSEKSHVLDLYAFPMTPTAVEDSVFTDVYEKAEVSAKRVRPDATKLRQHMWLTPENVPKAANAVALLEVEETLRGDDPAALIVRKTEFRPEPESWRDPKSGLAGFCSDDKLATLTKVFWVIRVYYGISTLLSVVFVICVATGALKGKDMVSALIAISTLAVLLLVVILFILFVVNVLVKLSSLIRGTMQEYGFIQKIESDI